MKRCDENKTLIAGIVKAAEDEPKGTYEEMMIFHLAAIFALLTDISKSLASIADAAESGVKE